MVGTIFFLCSILVIIIWVNKKCRKYGNSQSFIRTFGLFMVTVCLILQSLLISCLIECCATRDFSYVYGYEYTVRLYYLGGSEEIINVISTEDPQIRGYHGHYVLRWHDMHNSIIKEGVVRYQILNKKEIIKGINYSTCGNNMKQ